MRRQFSAVALLLALLAIAIPVHAQAPSGEISGTVVDSSGLPVLLGCCCVGRACGGECSLCGSRANCRVFADDLTDGQQSEGEQHEDESAQPPLDKRLT